MPVAVEGLRELQRALLRVAAESKAGLGRRLQDAAEPVRVDSESNAVSEIRNIGDRWSQMRLGVIQSGVYVAPAARRAGGSPRPNLYGLLLRSMTEALDSNSERIVEAVDRMLDEISAANGF